MFASVNSDPSVDTNYVQVFQGVCRQKDTLQTFLFAAPIEARSVRIQLDSNYGNSSGISIAEVQVLATPAVRKAGTWSLIAPSALSAASGVAVAPDGLAYVADGSGAILHLDATGSVIRQWTANDFQDNAVFLPEHLALAGDGTVYVVDNGNNQIDRIDPSGTPAGSWPFPAVGTIGAITLGGIAVDRRGDLLVTDITNDQVLKISPAGTLLAQWGATGSERGQFQTPLGIAVDSQNNVLVADSENQRIQELSSTGQPLRQFGSSGTAIGQFGLPRGLTIDHAGRLWVTDGLLHRVQAFTLSGQNLGAWGEQGRNDPGKLDDPWAIAAAPDGSLLIADTGNARLQRLVPTGLTSSR